MGKRTKSYGSFLTFLKSLLETETDTERKRERESTEERRQTDRQTELESLSVKRIYTRVEGSDDHGLPMQMLLMCMYMACLEICLTCVRNVALASAYRIKLCNTYIITCV